MKKYLIIPAILLLAASCSKQQSNQDNSNQGTTNPPAVNTYVSPDKYGFSIKYSDEFGFSTDLNQVAGLSYIPVCDQNMVACLFLNKDTYKGTNFDGAGVSINIDPSLDTQAKCYNFKVSTSEAQTEVSDVAINGTTFKSAVGGGGAAGHYDKLQVYRNFHNNMCYEIAEDMVSTQLANYPEGTVKQFSEDEVWQKLQTAVNSFQFTKADNSTNNSVSVALGTKVTVTGTTICLPHKNTDPNQPQTMECAIGLKDDATGINYSLKNANPPFYDTNVKVKVMGTLADDSKSIYDTAGAIEISSITKLAN